MPCSFGVVGFGRIAQAIVIPLLENGVLCTDDVCCIVASQKTLKQVRNQSPTGLKVLTSDDSLQEQVWKAPTQLLAVKPQQLSLVSKQSRRFLTQNISTRPLLISVLAGVNLKTLQKAFPFHDCVRAVPNTPALVGAGLTAFSWADKITEQQKQAVKDFFLPVSEVFELPEEQLDAFLALTSSGPGYLALVSEALADGAVAAGLPRALSYALTHKTIEGTALLLQKKKLHPGELKDMVASPGGTTISAIRHLEKSGLRSALIEAVLIARNRSREISSFNES